MENMNFWIAQFIGLIALILLVFSYSRKNTNKILAVQIVSALLYCVHYYLLGAYSGFMICLFEMMRDYLYYKTDLDDFVFIISIPIYILMGYISYHTFADLLPLFASTIDGFGLTKSKRVVVFGSVISYTIWLIYDIYVKSYSGILTSALVIIANLFVLLFDKNLFKDKNISMHIDLKK